MLALGVARLAAPGERVDARQQLRHVIGLGEVVVAARAQTRDAVVDLAERAQDEHRKLAARRPQRLHQGEPVELRQHPVDDGEIDGDRGRHVQSLQAVRGDIHRMPDFAQRLRQVIARNLVIFDDQNVHD